MALEKLTAEKKVFLGSLLYSIIENKTIREANISSFKNILLRHEQAGYDVSGFRSLARDYSNFENLARTTAADMMLKTKNISKHLAEICSRFENKLMGYIDIAFGAMGVK